MEHALPDEAMDRMVRFFEILGTCPSVGKAFGQCPAGSRPGDADPCGVASPDCARFNLAPKEKAMSIASMKPGQRGVVTQTTATGALRQRLLDMGVLPETKLDVKRSGPGGHPLGIRCRGARLALRRAAASSVLVRADA
jgi:Fe2+ transport system protein FeoA